MTDLSVLGFLPNIGFSELILILVMALIFVGPSKLPELGRTFGKSINEFKKATSEILEPKEENNEETK